MNIPESITKAIKELDIVDVDVVTKDIEELLQRDYTDDTCFNHSRERTKLSVKDLCKQVDKAAGLQRGLQAGEDQIQNVGLTDAGGFEVDTLDNAKCAVDCVNDMVNLNEELSTITEEAQVIIDDIPRKESQLYGLKVLVSFYLEVIRLRLYIRTSARFKKRITKKLDNMVVRLRKLDVSNDIRAEHEKNSAIYILRRGSVRIKRIRSKDAVVLTEEPTGHGTLPYEVAYVANRFVGRNMFRSPNKAYSIKFNSRPRRFSSTNNRSIFGRYLKRKENYVKKEAKRRNIKGNDSFKFLDKIKVKDISYRKTLDNNIRPKNLGKFAWRLAFAITSRDPYDLNRNSKHSLRLYNSTLELLVLFEDKVTEIINDYSATSANKLISGAVAKIGDITCCGEKISNSIPEINPDDFAPNKLKDKRPDLSHNSFDVDNKPTFTDLEYWQKYSIYLNLLGLIPKYWAVGLIIAGVRVPLPIIWIPLIVLNTPIGIFVIWLTINGIVICPTVWLYRFPDNTSTHLALFKGVDQTIRKDTGCQLLNPPVVGGININVDLTKTLPFKQDDLPTVKRMGLANPPYLIYLDKWLSKAKPKMGL